MLKPDTAWSAVHFQQRRINLRMYYPKQFGFPLYSFSTMTRYKELFSNRKLQDVTFKNNHSGHECKVFSDASHEVLVPG